MPGLGCREFGRVMTVQVQGRTAVPPGTQGLSVPKWRCWHQQKRCSEKINSRIAKAPSMQAVAFGITTHYAINSPSVSIISMSLAEVPESSGEIG
ncbi:hypothetical protein CEXT_618921 [Caerostris extrusa]|uniref:Uncharacterized protein n=1 Tax=Caerostris extrusa TaxID=172846 RepID=A0AAV4T4P5_CAEEX|nr:hypothetical protein CEXT_618921 [Caerostris extrusa]